MKNVIVVATWSSGSTAMTGYLDRCGGYTCPPHVRTSDERTPIAYEPKVYRDSLAELFDEFTLKRKGDPAVFYSAFDRWYAQEVKKAKAEGCSHIVLKHPLQTFVLPYLDRKLSPYYVFVTRSLEDIEKTRMRRRIHSVYGRQGAKVIYLNAFNFLVNEAKPFIAVPFSRFRSDKDFRAKILDFVELAPGEDQLNAAEDFLVK